MEEGCMCKLNFVEPQRYITASLLTILLLIQSLSLKLVVNCSPDNDEISVKKIHELQFSVFDYKDFERAVIDRILLHCQFFLFLENLQ